MQNDSVCITESKYIERKYYIFIYDALYDSIHTLF